ncbi:MAG: ATP-binding cassette domain-containing protein [Verrucomicrobiales bacterium]|nr:ATP-binding cassette domain-containing protein [Verrucomicrobiales bacterium]
MPDLSSHIELEVRDLSHWFGPKKVLFEVNLKIRRGQFLSLVGPSGCGKSTLLRAIVGTHLPRAGTVTVHRPGGKPELVIGPGRDRGIVYQRYSLFPFLTARENVALGLKLDQTSLPFRWLAWPKWRRLRREHLAQADAMLERVRLPDARHLFPQEMSGGMQQRVAIAQAMIMKPEIILLDEPFGALDEATREDLQSMLIGLYQENHHALGRGEHPPLTLIIVTHELNEALYVGDRIVGLSQYWDWRAEGHSGCPGATILYDREAPVFEVKNGRDFEKFTAQREEIRELVFESSPLRPRHRHVNYWPNA